MGNTQKRYTPEFKQKAIELLRASDATAAEVARDLGVDPSTLRKWDRDCGGSPTTPGGKNPFKQAEELKKLRRENERLKKENEILLKASAFFASRQM